MDRYLVCVTVTKISNGGDAGEVFSQQVRQFPNFQEESPDVDYEAQAVKFAQELILKATPLRT